MGRMKTEGEAASSPQRSVSDCGPVTDEFYPVDCGSSSITFKNNYENTLSGNGENSWETASESDVENDPLRVMNAQLFPLV